MLCPFCNHNQTQVIDSRDTENLEAIRRRRECFSCHKRFTTYERVESVGLRVIKKNGMQEEFDLTKLHRGITKACEKMTVGQKEIQTLVDKIEAELRDYPSVEIPSKKIGQMVMKHLKKLNKIAYVRFASVYREFRELEDLEKEVCKLLSHKK
jgi:transcriptional repressor NrdR